MSDKPGDRGVSPHVTLPPFLVTAVMEEMERQDRIHPDGYPPTRDGLRLGIAAAQDELDEALEAWREGRCKCPEPKCKHSDWSAAAGELIQTAAVILRAVRPL